MDEKVFYIEMIFGNQIRKNVVCGKEELINFLHHLGVMMEEEDHVQIYYHESFEKLDGSHTFQRMIYFEGDSKLLAETMKSY